MAIIVGIKFKSGNKIYYFDDENEERLWLYEAEKYYYDVIQLTVLIGFICNVFA